MATACIRYRGPEALVGALTQMLEEEGVEVRRMDHVQPNGGTSAASRRECSPRLWHMAHGSPQNGPWSASVSGGRVHGLLITPVDRTNPRLEWFLENRIPVVLVDRVAGRQRVCSVAVNDRLGGRLAVAHLAAQGHERIAFVGGPVTIQQIADRREGAMEALLEAGRRPEDLLFLETSAPRLPDGRLAGEKLATMASEQRPTAVFCANDLLALGVLQAMMMRDVAVPGEVAIVGYDDIQYAAGAAVPLSSVRQPREELGRTAAQLLYNEIAEGEHHRHREVVFEPELIVRESSAVPERSRQS